MYVYVYKYMYMYAHVCVHVHCIQCKCTCACIFSTAERRCKLYSAAGQAAYSTGLHSPDGSTAAF